MALVKKFSAITLAGASPALTDTLLGVGGGTTDLQYTLNQIAGVPFAFIGLGATTIAPGANITALTVSDATHTVSHPAFTAVQTINGAVDAVGIFFNMKPGGTPPNTSAMLLNLQYNSTDVLRVFRSGTLNVSGAVQSVSGTSTFNAIQIANGAGNLNVSGSTLNIGTTNSLIQLSGVATFIGSQTAATLNLGGIDAATAVPQITKVQGVVAGTSNTAGADWTEKLSAGTGTGRGGKKIWQAAPAGSTGMSQNALVTALTLDDNSNLVPGAAALGTTATDGFHYQASCAGAPTGVPTTYTGRVPLVIDTTNNKIMVYIGGAWKGVTVA